MGYSVNQLKQLAKNNPEEFLQIINNMSDVFTLTFAVEIMGEEITDESRMLPIIRRLLKHIHALVREGALYAVSSFYGNKKPPTDILERMKVMSQVDPSPGVKECASDLLKDFE